VEGKKTPLVIDDDPTAQGAIRSVLWILGWAWPTFVSDGKAALAILKKRPFPFDLIILDQKLPDMPGLEVLGAVKAILNRLPPIIMFTGDSDLTLEAKAKKLGVSGFLSKNDLSVARMRDLLTTVLGE
jgi:CheY-like chemotaxis protein